MQTGNPVSSMPKLIAVIIALLVCCSCAVIVAAIAIFIPVFRETSLIPLTPSFGTPATPTPAAQLERPPVESVPLDTLQILQDIDIPGNNPYELACRLKSICNVSPTVPGKPYQVGERETFWVLNSDTIEHRQIEAVLIYMTPHSYFWAEDGVDVNENDVRRLMDTFENEIYPTNREFFGSEWTPGIDGEPRIFVIYATGLGRSTAGYFNTTDSYNPAIQEYSNAHETFMISASLNLANPSTAGVLAHEFVHMIQFATDRNDETWMIEGFAEVGSFLNGYYPGVFDWQYAGNPDLQLTDWPADGPRTAHYGQAFLFLTYYLDRFGEEATKALNDNPINGLGSIDDTFAESDITDPQTGHIMTADDLFMDWAAALYLKDGSIGDGRYTYHNYPNAPQTGPTDVINRCPPPTLSRQVNQYGIDYISVTCPGDFTLHFRGSTVTKLLPADFRSGQYAFWSNQGDESHMTLTREFDFTDVGGPIEFSYWTWYEIEEDWDYVHVTASIDEQTWEILTTPSGSDEDTSGNSYGWGYTGSSGGWIQERVDLSPFAGQTVQVRFEYLTDAAVHEDGFVVDDIRIDAIGYHEDFEAGEGGWEGAGFVRVENVLPQTYGLSLIVRGDTTTVTHIELSPDQIAELPLSLGQGEEAVLVVTGTTRFTRQPAVYEIEIESRMR